MARALLGLVFLFVANPPPVLGLLAHPGARGAWFRRARSERGGGGLAYVVRWSTVNAFRPSHAAPGAFAPLDDAGRALLRADALTFEPFLNHALASSAVQPAGSASASVAAVGKATTTKGPAKTKRRRAPRASKQEGKQPIAVNSTEAKRSKAARYEGREAVQRAVAATAEQAASSDAAASPRYPPLLNRDEERELAKLIQTERKLQEIRCELARSRATTPSNTEWAAACRERGYEGMNAEQLRMAVRNGREAKQRMIESNLGLVRAAVAPQVRRASVGTLRGAGARQLSQDLTQEGVLGLIRAAEKFDAANGARFSTYATPWVRVYVEKWARNGRNLIHIPEKVVGASIRATAIERRLRGELGRNPTAEELAEHVGITSKRLAHVRDSTERLGQVTSLDITTTDSSGKQHSRVHEIADGGGDGIFVGSGGLQAELAAAPAHVKDLQVQQARQEVTAALADILSAKETRVLRVRYGLDDGVYRSIRECGEILGMPKDAVRGICSRAFRKLKETERGLALSNYDGILESPGSS